MTEAVLQEHYPWLTPDAPIIVAAPMMKITLARLAVAASAAGGIGFLAGGFDLSPLGTDLAEAAKLVKDQGLSLHNGLLPIGVGFQNWGSDLQLALKAIAEYPVAAVWFFAPRQLSDLISWTAEIRKATDNRTKVWIQVGTVAEAIEVAKTSRPDVIVVQGADSGGHGLAQRAGIISLLPEVADALAAEDIQIPLIAAGGIVDGRGVAAAIVLGASGVALGTRLLAADEAVIVKGYQDEILRAQDGGVSTVSSTVYDRARAIYGWPSAYTGRGVANRTYTDAESGMSDEENQTLYKAEIKKGDAGWGSDGRMTTYAGTGIGLVREVKSAADITRELQRDALKVLNRSNMRFQGRSSGVLSKI